MIALHDRCTRGRGIDIRYTYKYTYISASIRRVTCLLVLPHMDRWTEVWNSAHQTMAIYRREIEMRSTCAGEVVDGAPLS